MRYGTSRLFLFGFFLVMAAGIFLIAGCNKEGQFDKVPLGISFSLTGNFSPYGMNQKMGADLAIDEINGGSLIPGITLEPVYRDDKSSADTCMGNFRDLILNEKVLAIIGPTSSTSAFRADTVAQNNQVVVMGISNTVPGITEMGDYVFRNSLPESTVIPHTIQITHDRFGYSRVAVIYGSDDAYTLGAYDAFRDALESTSGITIVTTESIKKGDTYFADLLARVKAQDPEVIILAALVNEAAGLMVQARSAGIPDSVRFIGGNSFNTSRLWQLAGKAAEGSICGTAWICTIDTPGNDVFVANYTNRYGVKPDQFAAQAYAAVYIFADALKRSATLTREVFRNSLAATENLPTVLGSFSFDSNRDPVHPPVIQELIDGEFVVLQ